MNKFFCAISAGLILFSCSSENQKTPSLLEKTNVTVGTPLDSLNGVKVYYNGSVSHIEGRNVTRDGYNLGLKYQCVEFVKRYYYEYFHHKMPDSYGNAKDFFNAAVKDGELNKQRNLLQFRNGSKQKPRVNDMIVFGPTSFNAYGHVAIISEVSNGEIEIIQQNPGALASSRDNFTLKHRNGKWVIASLTVLGWLRKR